MNQPIHVMMDYEKALQHKKEILMSEINLIMMANAMKNHSNLRLVEFSLKLKIRKELKFIRTQLSKLQNTLPKMKSAETKRVSELKEAELRFGERHLESQLSDLQKKLHSLERKNNI
jgi:hypothetical protein